MYRNPLPDALATIAKRFGRDALHNRSHLIACLKDLVPEQKAARAVLDAAFSLGIPKKFDEACGKPINKQQFVLSQCSMQLCDDYGFEKVLVDEVMWAYCQALGFEAMPAPSPKPSPSPAPTRPAPPNPPPPRPTPPRPAPTRPASPTNPPPQPKPQPFQPPVLLPNHRPLPTLQPAPSPTQNKSFFKKTWAERTTSEKTLFVIGIIFLVPFILLLLFFTASSSSGRRRSRKRW